MNAEPDKIPPNDLEAIRVISWALEDVNEVRAVQLSNIRQIWATEAEVQRRFGPGTHGAHEAQDRSWLAYETWCEYVWSHPTVVRDGRCYRLATIAAQFMHEVYQALGAADQAGCEETQP